MGETTKFWKLDSPQMCRDFLKSVRVGDPPGARVEFLGQADGKQISIDEATDQQVMEAAAMVADAIEKGKK